MNAKQILHTLVYSLIAVIFYKLGVFGWLHSYFGEDYWWSIGTGVFTVYGAKHLLEYLRKEMWKYHKTPIDKPENGRMRVPRYGDRELSSSEEGTLEELVEEINQGQAKAGSRKFLFFKRGEHRPRKK